MSAPSAPFSYYFGYFALSFVSLVCAAVTIAIVYVAIKNRRKQSISDFFGAFFLMLCVSSAITSILYFFYINPPIWICSNCELKQVLVKAESGGNKACFRCKKGFPVKTFRE